MVVEGTKADRDEPEELAEAELGCPAVPPRAPAAAGLVKILGLGL